MRLQVRSARSAAALAPGAGAQTAVLGDAGTVHELRAGFFRNFFPDSSAVAPTTPVLVLLTTAADGTRTASLVPESDGLATDTPRLLLFDPGSGTFTAVWESAEMPTHRAVRLSHLLPQGWTVLAHSENSPVALKRCEPSLPLIEYRIWSLSAASFMPTIWRRMRSIETVTGTSTTASPKPGTVPPASLTPVANVRSCTSTLT